MANPGWPNPAARSNGRGLILPILLIVVGSVLLLNNLGVLAWSIWATLAQLWPVILILLGLELILGRRTSALGVILALVFVVVTVGSATHHIRMGPATDQTSAAPEPVTASANQSAGVGLIGPWSPADGVSHLEVPLGDTQSSQITVNVGAGNLSVGALPGDAPNLATADATASSGRGLTKSVSTHGGETDLTLAAREPNGFFWPTGQKNQPADSLAVSLARKVPLSLKTNLGVGQANLDLRDLSIQSLDVNSGVGQMTVQFPSGSGQTRANINSGAGGQTTLIIPANVGAYIHTAGGLVSVHVPSDRYTQVVDGYESNNYSNSTDKIEIYLHLGVGQVDVQ